MENSKNGAITSSQINFSGHVGRDYIQCLKWFKKAAGSLARRRFPTVVGSGEGAVPLPRNFFFIFFSRENDAFWCVLNTIS